MKKSKLSITLVTSFIAAMALTACNEVKAKDKAIVTFSPYGSKEEIALITQDVYNAYRDTSNGVTKFYDKILEVLIRYKFKEKGFKGEMDYSEIKNWAKNQVDEQKSKAKSNAKSNGTSYDEEWKSILKSNNVENANQLQEKFIYEKEKEVMTNWYADNTDNAEALKNEFLGVDGNGTAVESEVKAAMPYHIRHILVKVDEASDTQAKFYKGTISEAQAKLLSDTVTTLATDDYTFSQVANMYSEDGSASSGGDVGIMTNAATSGSLGMVNEFQLGIYAYDSLYNPANSGNAAADVIKEGLGFNSVVGKKDDNSDKTVVDALPNDVVEVPYQAFVDLGKYADVTADQVGNKLANGSATVYPRNILWNKYLNLHNVFVIKNAESGAPAFNAADPTVEFTNLVGANVYDAALPRFNSDGYLVDENDNVIIGVRSQYGIHFMIIEKSMYEYQTLASYYSTKLPDEEGYSDESYVGFIQSQSSEDYKKRADDVKSKITSFDATYDYRLYQDLTKEITITFNGAAKGLDATIKAYIDATRENNNYKQEDGLRKVWRTYTELLDVQEANRSATYTTYNINGEPSPQLTRLVSEQVALDFFAVYKDPACAGADAIYTAFAEGGNYYYYA